jgi:hypothetical protein
MESSPYLYESWDEVQAMIRELAPKSGYVTVTDKSPMGREEQITRYDFDDTEELRIVDAELAIRLARSGEGDEDEDDRPTFAGDPDDEADAGSPPDEDDDEDEAKDLRQDLLVQRCLAQIRRYSEGCMAGETAKVFRARCFMPKASTCLGSRQFVLRNMGTYAAGDQPLPMPVAPPAAPLTTVVAKDSPNGGAGPMPGYDNNIGLVSVKGFQALGEQYRMFGNMVLNGAERIAKVQEGNVGTLTKELTDTRAVVDQLLATIVTLKSVDAEASEKAAGAMSEVERSKLGKQAIETIGDVGKAFLVSRGLTAEAVVVLNALGANVRLRTFLERRDVQEYLRDEREVEALIAMLDAAIQHRTAAAQHAAANNNGSAASPAS